MQRKDAARWVILGGSFNPVHQGHVEVVRVLASLPGVAQVLVVPARISPTKLGQPPLPADLRWRMLCAALAGAHRVAVLDLELRRPPPSFTVDTVAELAAAYPQAEWSLAMGEDVLQEFAQWRGAAVLLERAGLIVLPRAGSSPAPASPSAKGVAAPNAFDLERAAQALPAPWPERVTADGPGRWVDATGRVIVECIPAQLPEISASHILATRSLEQVPPAARELLAEYWRTHPAAAAPGAREQP